MRITLAFCVLLCAACAGGQKLTLGNAIQTSTLAADAAYKLAVEACDAQEKRVIARSPTTIERDRIDIAKIRDICDRIFAAFEDVRAVVPLVRELEGIKL